MLRKLTLSLIGLGLILLFPLFAQEKLKGADEITKAIEEKNYGLADSLLAINTNYFFERNNLDTLPYYISFTGKIAKAQYGPDKAAEKILSFIASIKARGGSPKLMVKAYREAAIYFEATGQYMQAYKVSEEVLKAVNEYPVTDSVELARSEYNLGSYAHRLGNISLSQKHHRKSLTIKEALAHPDAEELYFSYNAMGSIFWYASKYDSARIFYENALAALKKMPASDMNKYYRPANIQNNLAALYSAEGKTSEGIAAMKSTIANLQKFLVSKEPSNKKDDAEKGLFEAIDNLAGIYKEIGDYGKAGDLLRYSYNQKKQRFNAENPAIFISEILLGQHYNSIREYDTALSYLSSGLSKIGDAEGDYLFWAGDASYALALLYENTKNIELAADYYKKSENFYHESYQGDYDNIYMDFARNAALFYAKNNRYKQALESASTVYDYLVSVNQQKSLQAFYQLLNIAEVNYFTGHYKEATQYSSKALDIVNGKVKDGRTVLDSVKIEVFKPKAILINAKADYELRPVKDSVYLVSLSARLKDALGILEKRKVLIDDAESINILIAENSALIDFAKKIELELYKITNRSSYLDNFINLHESALYNRIRSRLDKQQAIRFSHLPVAVQEKEQRLKENLSSSLSSDKPYSLLINDYLQSVRQWENFLDTVKKQHPAYYNMRYASIFRSLPQLQSSIPANTTLVRYFFADSLLYALVADSSSKSLVQLDSRGIEEEVTALYKTIASEKVPATLLNDLYAALWEPIDDKVKTQRVLIIPDGILFNLSFDMLTPDAVSSYKELAGKSLLSKHLISYHYSLFMLGNREEEPADKNYIAFAPGFSDEIKKEYLQVAKDSVTLDYKYLSLLPQPSTNSLAKKIKGLIGGSTYLDNASTQSSFRENAAGHKIVYIGTHAEYNNINPERSRLIFAKNSRIADDSNSLYLQDIYNCDVNSELTILTACESGRPGYQDGEGMVSLAHAFNYAGSKRILTGLWKIDEQSSSLITEYFVRNLQSSLSTDAALQKAKLQYLEQAEGRMLAPAYWAGLVMMGEPGTIALKKASPSLLPYFIGGVVLLIVLFLLFRPKKSGGK